MRKKRQETVLAFFVYCSMFLRYSFVLPSLFVRSRANKERRIMGVTWELLRSYSGGKGWKHNSVVANVSVLSVVKRTRAIVADMPRSPQIRVALQCAASSSTSPFICQVNSSPTPVASASSPSNLRALALIKLYLP